MKAAAAGGGDEVGGLSEEPEVLVGLGVEEVAGVLSLLLHSHAQAPAVLDQVLHHVHALTRRPSSQPPPATSPLSAQGRRR